MSFDSTEFAAGRGGRITLADETVSSDSDAPGVSDFSTFGTVYVEVHAQLSGIPGSGEAALDVVVESSTTGASWTEVDTASFTATGTEIVAVPAPDVYLRVRWENTNGLWSLTAAAVPSEVNVPAGGAGIDGTFVWLESNVLATSNGNIRFDTMYDSTQTLITEVPAGLGVTIDFDPTTYYFDATETGIWYVATALYVVPDDTALVRLQVISTADYMGGFIVDGRAVDALAGGLILNGSHIFNLSAGGRVLFGVAEQDATAAPYEPVSYATAKIMRLV